MVLFLNPAWVKQVIKSYLDWTGISKESVVFLFPLDQRKSVFYSNLQTFSSDMMSRHCVTSIQHSWTTKEQWTSWIGIQNAVKTFNCQRSLHYSRLGKRQKKSNDNDFFFKWEKTKQNTKTSPNDKNSNLQRMNTNTQPQFGQLK